MKYTIDPLTHAVLIRKQLTK